MNFFSESFHISADFFFKHLLVMNVGETAKTTEAADVNSGLLYRNINDTEGSRLYESKEKGKNCGDRRWFACKPTIIQIFQIKF